MIPVRNNVLLKPCQSDEISKGGIIVPIAYRVVSNRMTVVKVGNGTKEKPMLFTEGQIVFRVKDCGTEILINDEKYFLIDDNALIAINDN